MTTPDIDIYSLGELSTKFLADSSLRGNLVAHILLSRFDMDTVLIWKTASSQDAQVEFELIGWPQDFSPIARSLRLEEMPKRFQYLWNSGFEDGEKWKSDAPYNESEINAIVRTLHDRGFPVSKVRQLALMKGTDLPAPGETFLIFCGVNNSKNPNHIEWFFSRSLISKLQTMMDLLLPESFPVHAAVDIQKRMDLIDRIKKELGPRGGRRAIAMLAHELITDPAFNTMVSTPSGQMMFKKEIDWVWSNYLDMTTALEIVPSRLDESSPEKKAVRIVNENAARFLPLTRLSLVRKACWDKTHKLQSVEPELNEIERIIRSDKLWDVKFSEDVREIVFPEISRTVPPFLQDKTLEMAKTHIIQLEELRTCFFYLYYAAEGGIRH
jgi:hypothetical protein